MMRLQIFAVVAICALSQFFISRPTQTAQASVLPYTSNSTFISIDLRDLTQFAQDSIPEAGFILDSIKKNPALYKLSNKDKLLGIEFNESPVSQGTGAQFHLTALINSNKAGYFFRRLSVEINFADNSVSTVSVLEDVPISKTHFTIRVGLLQRKVILEDTQHNFRKIYPLEVGAIDPGFKFTRLTLGRPSIVTPIYTGAYLDRERASKSLHTVAPDYYHGLPFMPITRADGMILPIAFHIIQDPQMQRGFISHGCLRLRSKDLVELYAILAQGGSSQLPVTVSLSLPETEDHPYPHQNTAFMKIRNCDKTGKNPRICRDPVHYLTELDFVDGRPPFEQIVPLDGDKMDRADYATAIDPETGLPKKPLPPQMRDDQMSGALRGT